MYRATRKLIAIFMLIWLPLSGGSALAASLSMQAPHGDCHAMTAQDMQHQEMAGHQHHHASPSHEQQNDSCDSCGACHLACSAWLAASVDGLPVLQPSAQAYASHYVAYQSVSFVPLLPPPLARA